MKKIIFGFLFLLIIFMLVSTEAVFAQEDECGKSTVSLVFRDSQGSFIPNINFSIHSRENVEGLT